MSFGSSHDTGFLTPMHCYEKQTPLGEILRRMVEATERIHAGLNQIKQGREKLMSKISEFEQVEQGIITQISTDLGNIVVGIQALDTLIQGFQNSPGTLSPADQASLDNIVKASQVLKAQAEAISTAAPQPVVVVDPAAGAGATGTGSD